MTNAKIAKQGDESGPPPHMNKKLASLLEMLVRMLGLVNGTITIHARGGQLCRGIEIINRVDVLNLE